MPRVNFFELSADDPERAMKFYEKVFGWKFQKWGDQDYWLTTTGSKEEIGIDGAIQPRKPQSAPVVNTIGVTNLDEAIEKVEQNGGKIAVPKIDIPNVGTMVYFLDTEGNMHGLIQPMPNPQL
jgi:predicted enzyme related to lactoylglutathione lyase